MFHAVRRYANFHADAKGVAATPIPGLTLIRAVAPGELQYAISRPLVALVVQGHKRVQMGTQSFELSAGDSMLITADVPTVSQVTDASEGEPYFSLVLDLDPAVIAQLIVEVNVALDGRTAPVHIEPTDPDVAATALRLVRLLDNSTAATVLQSQLVREMHYWLLAGRHGPAIRNLGLPGSSVQRVSRAVAIIRAEYAKPLRVEQLAEAAGMSASSLHQHFRSLTSLSPLQFQKQLRLIEARRMMLSEGTSASDAAYTVGYESVPQFTREYGRMFGAPPAREIREAKTRIPLTN
ncbi:MAG: AraC family transcriptional regulator [Lysobacter sp.]|nr:AraC family transcriptional regulator [Lysobacter sp.]